MEYKLGDEVLVKAKITGCPGSARVMLKVDSDRTEFFTSEEDIIPVPDMTAEEAWKIAEDISRMESIEIMSYILEGDAMYPVRAVFHNLTPQETKDKIEAWKEAKNIKVGSEVIPKEKHYRSGERGIVSCINSSGKIGVNFHGNDFVWYEKNVLKKTGRYIDFDKILEQIGGDK